MASVKLFSPASPQFFKMILDDTLLNNKIQIPKRIVRKCGANLSNPIFLKLPCGSRWEIGLTKCDDKVWIDKGWPEFRDCYSLVRGHLLVFRFEGNSQFNVLIFDQSTTEIDYPFNPNCLSDMERQPHNESYVKEETENDDFVEILERFPSPSKTREKSPLESSSARKRKRNSSLGETQVNQSHPRTREFGIEKSNSPPKWSKCGDVIKRQCLTAKEKAQAFKRAGGFKSKGPSFMVAMQPSSVGDHYLLALPYPFRTKYLGGKNAEVILKAPDKGTWLVKYIRERFETGWRAFALDNDLKVGDVCVFVLTKISIPILFEVAIFHENRTAISTSLPVHKGAIEVSSRGCFLRKVESHNTVNKRSMAFGSASDFRSRNPFFTIAMRASYAANNNFCIPCKFARTYINKKEAEAILNVSDGRSWSVLYRLRETVKKSPVAEFAHGWSAFAWDNSLEKGDICTFELIQGNDILFKVSIVKAHDCLPRDKLRKLRSDENGTSVIQTPLSSGVRRASEAASKFFSKHPYFQVDFATGYLWKKEALHLPAFFVKSYFTDNLGRTVNLLVGKRSWPVQILAYPSASCYMFSRGWSAFARESSLSQGDICIFELIERNPVTLKVSIYSETP